MADYKGVAFSFEGKRRSSRKKLFQRFLIILVLLSAATASIHFWQRNRMHNRLEALLTNQIRPGEFRENPPALWFAPAARREALALAQTLDNAPLGETQFDTIQKKSTLLEPAPILDRLLERAQPAPFSTYARFLEKHNALPPFYTILLKQAGFQALAEAELTAGLNDAPHREGIEQVRNRIRVLNRELTQKEVTVVLDRDNQPLGTWNPTDKRLSGRIPGFSLAPLAPLFQSGYQQVRLTLSLRLQQHAETHFRPYHGTLVLLDLENGEILCAYSKPTANSPETNPALTDLYEPGSILKLLTLFTYSESRLGSIFPYHCKGNMPLGGRTFYDWIAHGTIESAQEAMALSCNLVFAGMGLKLGPERVHKGLKDFFFDRSSPWSDGPFTLQPGTTRPVEENSHGLANLSIGLEEIRMSTFHAALITGLIATNGILPGPRLIASGSTLLGLVISRPLPPKLEIHPRSIHYMTLQQSMAMAVDHAQGTARRAQNSHLTLSAKTGTAGDSRQGLDAVLIAYFPRQNPRYALAFRLEHGGKAEYNGALFLNHYLSSFPR
jgi:hypothetical protein